MRTITPPPRLRAESNLIFDQEIILFSDGSGGLRGRARKMREGLWFLGGVGAPWAEVLRNLQELDLTNKHGSSLPPRDGPGGRAKVFSTLKGTCGTQSGSCGMLAKLDILTTWFELHCSSGLTKILNTHNLPAKGASVPILCAIQSPLL